MSSEDSKEVQSAEIVELTENSLESITGGATTPATTSTEFTKMAQSRTTALAADNKRIVQDNAQRDFDRMAQKMDTWGASNPKLAAKNNFHGI